MDCFHDFCLFCEKETQNAPYCSSRCRMSDQLRSGTMLPNARASNHFANSYDSTLSSASHSTCHHYHGDDSRAMYATWRGQNTMPVAAHDGHDLRRSRASRSLSTCSSQSSFSMSLVGSGHQQTSHSIAPPPIISETARRELTQYAELFDQTREQRRPSCPGLKPCWELRSGAMLDETSA